MTMVLTAVLAFLYSFLSYGLHLQAINRQTTTERGMDNEDRNST